MAYENLLVSVEDRLGFITLNRPDKLNTFSTQTATELDAALQELDADPEVRVVVLKAAGKAFCAGIDINEMAGKSAHQLKEWVEIMEKPLHSMSRLGKPVITSVQGAAAANGAGLVAASDLCIASRTARIGYTAVKVGLFCLGPAVPLVRTLGRKKAFELLFFGDLITAEEACQLGLVNKAVPPGELEEATRQWAARLAELSPLAVQLSKKAFYTMADLEYGKAFDYMNEAFARLASTEDAAEGVAAFLEKRRPVWKGR